MFSSSEVVSDVKFEGASIDVSREDLSGHWLLSDGG